MRACPAGLAADIANEVISLCRLWDVARSDGTVLRFTDAVRPVVFNGNTYRADLSFSASAFFTSSSMANAQSVTITLAMGDDGDGISETDLRAGLYAGAIGTVTVVNYEVPTNGGMVIFSGRFGQIMMTDKKRAQIAIIPNAGDSGRGIGTEVYQPTCRASLGDAACTIDLTALTATFTVTSVTDGFTFAASADLGQADNHWIQGTVKWLTGGNAGTFSTVQTSNQSAKSITTVASPIKAVAIGDTGSVVPGCDKQPATCRDKFANEVNFRGEPFVPQSLIISITNNYVFTGNGFTLRSAL